MRELLINMVALLGIQAYSQTLKIWHDSWELCLIKGNFLKASPELYLNILLKNSLLKFKGYPIKILEHMDLTQVVQELNLQIVSGMMDQLE